MTSLGHQKIWAFIAGVGVAGAAYIQARTLIWQRAATVADSWPGGPPPPEPLPEPRPMISPEMRAAAARKWNQGMDSVAHPLIKYLSERGL